MIPFHDHALADFSIEKSGLTLRERLFTFTTAVEKIRAIVARHEFGSQN